MDLAAFRAYPRDYLDLDQADISNALMDQWVATGQRRVLKARARWPHLETSEVITTVAGQTAYEITTKRIEAVDDTVVGPLSIVDHTDATSLYWQGGTPRVGRPEAVSRYGGQLHLWPTPDGVYTITVYGQRAAVTPTAAGDVPDVPEDLHDVILEWVMQEAYLQQDDPEMASVRKSLFDEKLAEYIDDETQGEDQTPIVFGGGPFDTRVRRAHSFDVRGPGLGEFGGW